MDFRPQAIFLDLDGTLVDTRDKKISKQNLETVKKVNKKIPCFISTGRGLSESLLKTTNDLGLNYGVAQNGGLIFDRSGNIIRKFTINPQTYQKLWELFKKQKVSYIVNSQKIIYSQSFISKFVRFVNKEYSVEKFLQAKNITEITKILVISPNKKKLIRLQKEIVDNFKDLNVLMTAKNSAIEVSDINASKGKANSFICSLINVDPFKAIHIGDSMNDSTTIHYLGALIAMKNSSVELKNIATEIGEHYKKAGVSKILNKLIKLD